VCTVAGYLGAPGAPSPPPPAVAGVRHTQLGRSKQECSTGTRYARRSRTLLLSANAAVANGSIMAMTPSRRSDTTDHHLPIFPVPHSHSGSVRRKNLGLLNRSHDRSSAADSKKIPRWCERCSRVPPSSCAKDPSLLMVGRAGDLAYS
jgi:hypothetical protein